MCDYHLDVRLVNEIVDADGFPVAPHFEHIIAVESESLGVALMLVNASALIGMKAQNMVNPLFKSGRFDALVFRGGAFCDFNPV